MNLQGRNLSIEMRGDDVALLQAELVSIGYPIPEREQDAKVFGIGTQDAVRAFQTRNGIERTGVVDGETAREINARVAVLHPSGGPAGDSFTVSGTVWNPDGTPAVGVKVRAFDRDLNPNNEQPLNNNNDNNQPFVTTGTDGRYSITYLSGQFNTAEKATADLIVRGYDQAMTLLVESDIYFNAPANVTIDLFIPAALGATGVSEYERVAADVATLMDGQNIPSVTALTVDQVEFIAGDTQMPALRIAYFVAATRLAGMCGAPAQVFYAFAREGLPTALHRLLAQPADVLRRAILSAVDRNIIPTSYGVQANIDSAIAALKSCAAANAVATPNLPGFSTVAEVLTAAGVSGTLHQPFVSEWLA